MTISSLFKKAQEAGASDLHLVVGQPPYLRVDGELQVIKDTEELSSAKIKEIVNDMLSVDQKKRLEADRGLDLSYAINDAGRFRVNVFYERSNLSLVVRIISAQVPTMEDVGMPEVVYELMRENRGLVLLTGPTGCGKSTSLAAMVDLINSERSAHIVTLEDPIEYLHTNRKSIIVQRELGEDMSSFAEGLRHVLRQDPNVIMVGEMRDLETIAAALTLAETGHLVLATLHTYDAAQTIDRVVDVFPPHQQNQIRTQLSMTLKGVISQHLLPAKKGGRVAVREIMINNPAVSNIIRENKASQLKSVIQTSAKKGMFTIEQDLKRLVKEDIIDEEQADKYLNYSSYNVE
ncbi:MAG: type IV pili twitching motility protein PilT [Candidatus Komeilibacteria bacterium CG_4_10_14_0_2_um_filter_37_10]|uniref:Type IV pili twitching motility protein PilT n=1 Tax=Candidatus Komeilibacteria bacterium CG_4_10_14_0_2_um_filter_37_10 TaxID=1974470 RepID=A0A2M7VGC4_9BACT|nr:MAG: type IV pili twitching motility protein PilT [Candidatus Komeilibacteria bacterium CG_4_10_14_0_2_um_filter_37_10]